MTLAKAKSFVNLHQFPAVNLGLPRLRKTSIFIIACTARYAFILSVVSAADYIWSADLPACSGVAACCIASDVDATSPRSMEDEQVRSGWLGIPMLYSDMMRGAAAIEAKTHLSSLPQDVARGRGRKPLYGNACQKLKVNYNMRTRPLTPPTGVSVPWLARCV